MNKIKDKLVGVYVWLCWVVERVIWFYVVAFEFIIVLKGGAFS